MLIVVCVLQPGDKYGLEGRYIVFSRRVAIGNKAATRLIAKGEKIFKYGGSIGSASRDMRADAHIHPHNLPDDAIHTYIVGKYRVYNR